LPKKSPPLLEHENSAKIGRRRKKKNFFQKIFLERNDKNAFHKIKIKIQDSLMALYCIERSN